jgi:hypothetical protein
MRKDLFTLGELYVSDFVAEGDLPRGGKTELKMVLDTDDSTVRLDKVHPSEDMYGKYWYRSSTNLTMKKELASIVTSINDILPLNKGDLWVDIACNDGTLLSYVSDDLVRVGIDPVDDSYKQESEKHADLIIQDFFSYSGFSKSKYGHRKAMVVTTIAMFYDLDDPRSFMLDVKDMLDDKGLWVLQLSYTPLMLKQIAFDNICHEHVYYYSLYNIKNMLHECGLDVVDVALNDVNGGSFRLYVMKSDSDKSIFGTAPYRDCCDFRIRSLLEYEKTLKLDSEDTWKRFYENINSLRDKTREFILQEKAKGKTIWAYGASTKGNTLLQYFNLDSNIIDGIAERNPKKFGLKTVGTNIPIFSESHMREVNPDYLLILPWQFIKEFRDRESQYLDNGGKFIVPCPEFYIVDKEGFNTKS